jgi:GH15 family glucan-1,4-alpha-glucosidase
MHAPRRTRHSPDGTEPHLELVREHPAGHDPAGRSAVREVQPGSTGVGGVRRLPEASARIEDYGFLSDCRSAALIDRDGSVDWLCWPRFDSPSLFGRILDAQRGGSFAITPTAPFSSARRYVPRTNVLQTTFHTNTGVARIHDWLDIGPRQALCRLVECLEGDVELSVACEPRPSYATLGPGRWTEHAGRLECPAGGDDRLILRGLHSPRETFTLSAGEARSISLGWNQSGPPDLFAALQHTIRFWQDWAGGLVIPDGIDPELCAHVERSALTLKGLQYRPTGAFVAAPTTSLPETIGGDRNWDYRFCWLRDAAFTLYGLRATGKTDEAEAWLSWIDEIVAEQESPELQIAYAIDGSAEVPEAELPHLAGHRESRPVRVGNGAARQRQLDVPGTLADAIWLARLSSGTPLSARRWELVQTMAERTAAEWRLPDAGIWEIRGEPQHFVYSKVMCWVMLDRALRLARIDRRTGAPVDEWRAARDAIKADVLERGYDRARRSFTQAYGSGSLDAANLLLAQVGFIAPRDPRFVSTVRAIQQELGRGGQVHRYLPEVTDDGFTTDEGTFTICTFWLCLALQQIGAGEEALALFAATLERANDLGLLSEELCSGGAHLGNFPQAFSHTAILACVAQLGRRGTRRQPLRIAA